MNTKLRKALIRMMNFDKVSFFVGEILNKEFVLDNSLPMPTMATDGVKIYYTDEWVDKCSDDELVFSIVHEFFHIIFKHPHFVKTMNLHQKASNIAQDVVINAILQKDGIGSAPEGVITANYNDTVTLDVNGQKIRIEKASEKSFLEVYKLLPKIPPPKDGGGNGQSDPYGNYKVKQDGESVGGKDNIIPKELTEEEQASIDEETNNIEAAAKSKGIGTAFARSVGELTKGVVPWKNYIRPSIDRATAGFPTYSNPNRRNTSRNIIKPSIKRLGVNVTVAIDTSGSIGKETLSYFLGEIQNILDSYPRGSVTANVLYHTDEVYAKQEKCKDMKEMMTTIKSGGTCHHDVFKQAEELNSKVLVCLTDGYTDYPATTTVQDTIIVCIEKNGSCPKFAKRIDVDTATWSLD